MIIITNLQMFNLVLFLLSAVLLQGNFIKNEKYNFEISTNSSTYVFKNFKSKKNGKLSGTINLKSKYSVNWVWFNYSRFDKKGNKSTAPKSLPIAIFEGLSPEKTFEIKNISIGGVSWLKSYDFNSILALEYEKQAYLDFANQNNLPILIKSFGYKYDSKSRQNKIFLNIINVNQSDVKKVSFIFLPADNNNDLIANLPTIESFDSDGFPPEFEKEFLWNGWSNNSVKCPILDQIEVTDTANKTYNFQGEKLLKLFYKSSDGLYPNKSLEVTSCHIKQISVNNY